MTINFYCPHCEAFIQAPEGSWGRGGKCLTCKKPIQVPAKFELMGATAADSLGQSTAMDAPPVVNRRRGHQGNYFPAEPSMPQQRQLTDDEFFEIDQVPLMFGSGIPSRLRAWKKKSTWRSPVANAIALVVIIVSVAYIGWDLVATWNTVTERYVRNEAGLVYEDTFRKGDHGQLVLIERKAWTIKSDSPVLHAHYKGEDTFHGSYVRWESGKPVEKGEYVNGKRHGEWLHQGSYIREREYKGEYVNGSREGLWEVMDEDLIRHKLNFKNNRAEGYYVSYYSNGQKRAEGMLSNGTLAGDWKFWRADGSVQEQRRDFFGHWYFEGESTILGLVRGQ